MTLDLETLQNDADALAVLVRLAEYGAECCEKFNARIGTPGERQSDYPAAVTVARLFDNGAGGYEADAVLAWVRARHAETENSIAALDGSGMPAKQADALQHVRATIETALAASDLTENAKLTLTDCADYITAEIGYEDGRKAGRPSNTPTER